MDRRNHRRIEGSELGWGADWRSNQMHPDRFMLYPWQRCKKADNGRDWPDVARLHGSSTCSQRMAEELDGELRYNDRDRFISNSTVYCAGSIMNSFVSGTMFVLASLSQRFHGFLKCSKWSWIKWSL